jgi:hypothetical protein
MLQRILNSEDTKMTDDESEHTTAVRGADGRFLPGRSASPATQLKPGHPWRWQPGQSGNPSGKPRRQVEFERALADALAGDNPESRAEELANLVWAAARKGEAWAVQLLFTRLAPQPLKVEVSRGEQDDFFDPSRLNDAQLNQLVELLERATDPRAVEGGEGPAPAA